ncbi:molecular chaperone DnaJ [Pelistega indica]|uniref:Molecular chaperone DnaJ n=1 Tax=Pelistega indica TaxID=1414851 RepID=V8FYT7_9BURK|nr:MULTISPECIES: molecular chaperone DnaJ [Pelistega]ETD69335.1 molecular chaperone DnaJ [Pelistega indica]
MDNEVINRPNNSSANSENIQLKNSALYAKLVYGIYIISMFTGLPMFVGVIIAYIRRGDALGTIYESHFSSQIKIFWYSMIALAVAFLTYIILIGWLVLLLWYIWFIYKVIIGLMRCLDEKPLY